MEPKIKQIKKILNKYGINVYNWRNEIAKEINDLFLESSPSEVCYPESFEVWKDSRLADNRILYYDGFYIYGKKYTLPELLTFWRELPENKDK